MPSSGEKIRVVFFGNERIATGVKTTAPTLRMLLDEGFDVCCVVVSERGSSSRQAQELTVEKVAHDYAIPLINTKYAPDYAAELAKLHADIGVLVAFGQIIPQLVLDIFPHGILNIHPSLLPKHRGSTPIENAILSGEAKTGVSIMKLERKMDAGPIYGQTEIKLAGDESKQSIADTLIELGGGLLAEIIPKITSGSATPLAQDESSATYDQLIIKDSGRIDPNKSAEQLVREIRAYAEWPKSTMAIAGVEVIITSAHTVGTASEKPAGTIFADVKDLCLQTVSGILVIDSLKPAGKPEMTAAAFLAGHRNKL